MRKSRFSTEQIISFIKQADAGMAVSESSRLKRLLAEAHLDIEALKIDFGVKR